MPRNGSGSYSLPAGNPVSSGTLIEASWANTTLSDLASAMTDSLARSGEGGMTGPLRATDGTVSTPSVSFVSETATGFYRAGATDVRFAMAGVDVATLTTAGVTVGSTKVLALPDGTAAAPALTKTGDTNTGVFFPAADVVGVSTGGTERLRVDASGNVGVGVTPSAWGVIKAIEIGGFRNAVYSDNGSVSVGIASGAYYNTNWRYAITGSSVGRYDIAGNSHQWFTAPSGTAGNAITFTQAMTLDASGQLSIGVTSPSCGLDVRKQETSNYNTARFSNGTDIQFLDVICGRELTNGTVGGVVNSATMTLRSSGSVAGNLAFATGNNERARITSGGDLLVGTTSIVARISGVADSGVIAYFTNSSGTGVAMYPGNTSWSTVSDERLKIIDHPITDAATKVASLRSVIGRYKSDDEQKKRAFLIAQDVQAVLPEAVTVQPDGMLALQLSETIPLLVAAIKEQQSIITQLTARIEALEAQS